MSTHEEFSNRQARSVKTGAETSESGAAIQTVKAIISGERELNTEDFQEVAEYFDIPAEDTEQIVLLLLDCFDQNGRFQRETFENYLKDDQQAWALQADATYRLVKSTRKQGHSAQLWLLDQLAEMVSVMPIDAR